MPSTPELAFDWKFFTRIPNGMIVYKELKHPPNGGKIGPRFHHVMQAGRKGKHNPDYFSLHTQTDGAFLPQKIQKYALNERERLILGHERYDAMT